MHQESWETDEDRMIYRYRVHRDCAGWVIKKLEEVGIACKRTKNNDKRGDILIIRKEDVPRVQTIICQLHEQYTQKSYELSRFDRNRWPDDLYIEIKGVYLYGRDIEKIISKGTIISLVSTQRISKPGKKKLEDAGIAYADTIPESEFMNHHNEE